MLCQLRLDDFATEIQPTTNEKRHVETCEPPRSQWDPSHPSEACEDPSVRCGCSRQRSQLQLVLCQDTEAMSFEVVGAENVARQRYLAHHMSRHQERARLD